MIDALDHRDPAVADALAAIQRRAYAAEAALIGDDRIPPLHESADDVAAGDLEWKGIRRDGRLVAAIAVTGQGRDCDIERLVVDPDHARQGLGRLLVAAMLHHSMVTVATAAANGPARALYESLGFTLDAERDVLPGLTIVEYRHTNRANGTSFDADPSAYEAARPAYPPELFDLLTERCGLGPFTRVLEIGAGTGQATLPLLDRGARVVAFDAGSAMAERLQANTAGRACVVHPEAIERTKKLGRYGCFDLAVSATAFHWVDASIALPRIADHLVPGGWIALWWTLYRDRDGDEFLDALEPTLARFQTSARRADSTHAAWTSRRIGEIRTGDRFGDVEVVHWRTPVVYDAAGMRALFASFSDWSTLPEPLRTHILDEVAEVVEHRYGGSVTRTFTTTMYLARLRR